MSNKGFTFLWGFGTPPADDSSVIAKATEQMINTTLNLWGLPTLADQRRAAEQVRQLTQQVAMLTARVAALEGRLGD